MPEVVQLIGEPPSWFQLGPVEDLDGQRVRPVLGDWSHLNQCDRPPQYVSEGALPARHYDLHDRSDTRPAILQIRPGRNISELKGKHSGACAILFNGPTLKDHELHRIGVPIIGMNRTHKGNEHYNGPQPDYLTTCDDHWMKQDGFRAHPAIINGTLDQWEDCWRATRFGRMSPFSFDLARDGYCHKVPCSTGHLALQLAVYMGFTDLYCLGFDLGGDHLDGTTGSRHYLLALIAHQTQVRILEEHNINVWIVGSPRSRAPWPKVDFEVLCAAK